MKRFLLHVQCFLLLTALYPLTLSAQQDKDKNSLLWRISGNGLTKPSWLYGTIHLVDKQVFNFGDSLYAAFEACEGYAMELVPDSMAAFYLNNTRERKTLKQVLDAKTFDRLKKKLKERFDKKPEEVTVKEFCELFTKKINNPNNKDAMPVIMDAWFYNAARRQGKWVGGIEDTEDQREVAGNLSISFYINDFLNDHRSSKQMIDQMIHIYKEEDLEGIEMIEEATDNGSANHIMLRRNRKMAFRMDSLAHIRSMFFAVGAGHLPGDSGVISYLRRKGYTVQPVSSSKRIPADAWRFPVKEIPWVAVTANSGAFTVQLPGTPQETELAGENLDMKMYVDISSNMIYMAMSAEKKDNLAIDSLMAQVVKNMNKKAHVVESHDIKGDSIQGKEVIAKSDEAVYRLQCFYRSPMMYLTLVGSPLDTLVKSADAERFLKSLVIHKQIKSGYTPLSAFTSDRHMFSVKFPGKPSVRKGPGDERTLISTLYSSIDTKNDIYFQCLVQDMKKGFYLTGDTSVFRLYLNVLDSNKAIHLLSKRMDTLQQYPAMWLDFIMRRDGADYYNKVLSLHRGNRLYFLFATAGDSLKSSQLINNYFSSFSLLPAKEGKWSQQEAPDNSFTTWAASPVAPYAGSGDDNKEDDGKEIFFELYDSTAPCTYYVTKLPYSPYFWSASDTGLLRRTIDNYVSYDDSLLSYTVVTNGHHRGVEAVIRLADNNNVKKTRLLIAGDTLYTIYGIVPPEMLALDNSRRLFTDFRVNHTTPSTIFTNKAADLLQALQSPDSVVFQEAKATLRLVNFTKADLPLLHKAMLEWYPDSAEYNGVNRTIFNYITILRAESTLTAVQAVWDKLPADKEGLRYNLLGLLARYRTPASVSLVKDLLLRHIPRKGDAWALFGAFHDSLELLKPVFPELLPLLKDSLAAPDMVSLTAQMLDSNYLDIKLITSYKAELYKMAAHALKTTQQEDDYSLYTNFALIRVLAKLEEPVANQWVRKFLLQTNLPLKQAAAIALLEHGQPVESTELLKLAADKEHRTDFYDQLVKIQKTALFPKQYLTEQAFGESELYTYAVEDDYEVKKITFIGERLTLYKGVRKKFFLYRIDMSYDDEKIIHLGIAGPYGLKPAKPVTLTKATGIYWEQKYDATKLDTYLKAWLKEQEQYDTEQ